MSKISITFTDQTLKIEGTQPAIISCRNCHKGFYIPPESIKKLKSYSLLFSILQTIGKSVKCCQFPEYYYLSEPFIIEVEKEEEFKQEYRNE